MALPQMQNMLYEEATAKGRIREPRRYSVEFLSSDFILAALVLCIELQFKMRRAPKGWENGRRSIKRVGIGSP